MSSFYYIDRSDVNLEDVVFNENVSQQIEDFLLEQQFKEIGNNVQIGQLCGVSGDTIEYWRKKFNIPKSPDFLFLVF